MFKFETGNPLSGHAGEQNLTGIYITLPTLPPHLVSKFVLLNSIVYSKHLKKFGNATVFRKVIDDINDLADNGLVININGEDKKFFFQGVLVLGDNLGANSTCGFNINFVNVPFCRICTADHKLCKIMCEEMPELIRTKAVYDKELAEKSKSSSVKEKCCFNKLCNFCITQNRTVDMMHDVFEGMSDYSLSDCLTALIYEEKLFTLEELNERIANFEYGSSDSIPRPLTETYKDSKKYVRIKQSAAESISLIRYIPVIIGDLVHDKDNEYWQIILTLRKIVDIILAPSFEKANLWYLEYLIQLHHSLYKAKFGRLYPKMHMLLHYVLIMIDNGPVAHIWSMMQERKNKTLGDSLASSKNYKNSPETAAIRDQLQLCHLKETLADVSSSITLGSLDKDTDYSINRFDERHQFCQSYKSVSIDSRDFKLGSTILVRVRQDDEFYGKVVFGKIYKIFKIHNKIRFVVSHMPEIIFDPKNHAYKVNFSEIPVEIITINELPKVSACLLVKTSEGHFVVPRYKI